MIRPTWHLELADQPPASDTPEDPNATADRSYMAAMDPDPICAVYASVGNHAYAMGMDRYGWDSNRVDFHKDIVRHGFPQPAHALVSKDWDGRRAYTTAMARYGRSVVRRAFAGADFLTVPHTALHLLAPKHTAQDEMLAALSQAQHGPVKRWTNVPGQDFWQCDWMLLSMDADGCVRWGLRAEDDDVRRMERFETPYPINILTIPSRHSRGFPSLK